MNLFHRYRPRLDDANPFHSLRLPDRITMNTFYFRLLIVSLIALISWSSLRAEDSRQLSVGDAVPSLAITDQFDKAAPIPVETEKIIFIADMDANNLTHPLFEKEGDAYLRKHQSVLIFDIHLMPSLISTFIALPKMRSYPYTMRLI
ncbi:MAG: hypothetical protein ACHP7O_11895, partial [Burkholderiales bacterium]